jgi:chain length determinant protein EpsF
MNFNQLILALRARRKAFVLVLAAVIVAAVSVALVMPKRYVATATLLVDARDEQTMSPARLSARERAGYISTQIDLIQSGRVAGQVVRDLKLAQKPGAREAWETDTGGMGKIEDWIAANLLERLRADISAGNVLSVSYASSDPAHAAAIANAFAQAYLDITLKMRTEPSREAAEWFDEQLRAMRANVSQAQAKLTGYQKAKGITFADERADIDTARLTELSTAYAAARNARQEAQIRYAQARQVAASGTPDAMAEIMTSAAIAAVRAELTRAEGAFQAVSADLGPNHPVYQRHDADVKALRAKLTTEMRKVVASLGVAAQQAQKREEELKQAVAVQNERIHGMRDHRVELSSLSRDLENAQRSYDAVLARYVTNNIESRARSTNVALLTPAIEPLKPSQPKVGLISGLAVVIGLLLAAGVVYVLESLDRRVRSRADLESRLAVPSLGLLSKWQPASGRLLPAPISANRALPHPW